MTLVAFPHRPISSRAITTLLTQWVGFSVAHEDNWTPNVTVEGGYSAGV